MVQIYDVPQHTWAQLAKAGSNQNVSRKAGDTCSLSKGGTIEVIGTDPTFGTLVRYRLPSGENAAGAMCHDGALLFFPSDVIASWPAQGSVKQAMHDETNAKDAAVKRLLKEH